MLDAARAKARRGELRIGVPIGYLWHREIGLGFDPDPTAVAPDFAGLADDLTAAWNAPGVSMRARQRLLLALVTDIIADVDEAAREVVVTMHWRGGQHSQLRVRKPKT